MNAVHNIIQEAIRQYLKVRKKLIALGEAHPDLMGGNDNLIGRIGEYIAIRFLEERGVKAIQKHQVSSNKGFDLTYNEQRVQVKLLTDENKAGRTVRLTPGWNELILIDLNTTSMKATVGHMSWEQFSKARNEDGRLSENPVVKRTMLGPKGLFQYGEVFHDFEFMK